MIEISFTESAGGGLKMAHALLHNQQSSSQTTLPTEIPPSFQAYVGENVFCFSLMLTVGKISEELFFSQRQDILQQLYHDLPKDLPSGTQMAKDCIEQTKQQMTMLKKRLQEKETIRIWYSQTPDDICGFYWFCHLLQQWQFSNTVYLLKLPDWEYHDGDHVNVNHLWSEVAPEAFFSYLPLQQVAPPSLIQYYAQCWHTLQEENGSLRAIINNNLLTVPLTFYDFLIIKTFAKFHKPVVEAFVIGKLLSKEAVGIHDTFLHARIQFLLQKKLLKCIEKAEDKPYYDKLLLSDYLM